MHRFIVSSVHIGVRQWMFATYYLLSVFVVSSPVGNADGSLTVNVTIIIPSVRRPHEGQFKCLAGADNKIYNLLVLGKHLTSEHIFIHILIHVKIEDS